MSDIMNVQNDELSNSMRMYKRIQNNKMHMQRTISYVSGRVYLAYINNYYAYVFAEKK
jgi:hypothetical protein